MRNNWKKIEHLFHSAYNLIEQGWRSQGEKVHSYLLVHVHIPKVGQNPHVYDTIPSLITKQISYYDLIIYVCIYIYTHSIEIRVNVVDTMVLCGSLYRLISLGTCFMAAMSIDPHPKVKGILAVIIIYMKFR